MANVKFYVQGDNSSGMRAISQVKGAIGGLASSISGGLKGAIVGAFGAAAIGETIRRTIEYADNIDEASSRIDVGIEKLQEWTFAAKMAGASLEDIVAFTERLTKFAGSNKGIIELRARGIDANQTPEQLLEALSKKIQGKSATEVSPLLQSIAGKSGGKMFNFLASDLEYAANMARAMGAVMDTETTVKLGALGDQFSILSQIIVSKVGPALVGFTEFLIRTVVKAYSFIAGKAASAGAKTAGLSWSEMIFAPFTDKKTQQGIIDRQKNDPNQKIYNETAETLESNITKSAEAFLKGLRDMLELAVTNAANRGKSKPPQPVSTAPKVDQLKGDPTGYLSIGGLAGINPQYRIERLNADQLEVQKEIRDLLIRDAVVATDSGEEFPS